MGLDEATVQFAEELSSLFSAVLEYPPVFEIIENQRSSKPRRIVISKAGAGGIPLSIDGTPAFQLMLSFECSWNATTQQMTVVESEFSVLLEGVREPLWRYDFNRALTRVPIAHLNVHAHRDEIAWARSLSRRSGVEDAKLRKLHFPFGGARFRPTIEDLLQMLIDEFGIDCKADSREKIAHSRNLYLNRQLTAAVMEDPITALTALEKLGYAVEPPSLL